MIFKNKPKGPSFKGPWSKAIEDNLRLTHENFCLKHAVTDEQKAGLAEMIIDISHTIWDSKETKHTSPFSSGLWTRSYTIDGKTIDPDGETAHQMDEQFSKAEEMISKASSQIDEILGGK
jgi:hypothetical protein